jgi:TatD DNase family protein
MNNSGICIREVIEYFKIDAEDVIVFHDDLDIEFGKVKAKFAGSSAGHNGIESIDKFIGKDYSRVRIGIGRPKTKADVSDHVLKDFDDDRKQIINECKKLGVTKLLLPNIDSNSMEDVIKISNEFKGICFPMVGLHPCYVKDSYKNDLDYLKPIIKSINTVAIGEIGIDLYWDKTFVKEQQEAFDMQIQWAKKYELPFVVHCRDAFDEVFEVLDGHNPEDLSGIFHCFTGTLEQAKRVLAYNLKLGIGGVVTFKNGKLDQFLNQIPLSEIVLETDAPYLAPTPYRGKRNESSYIQEVASKVAAVYGLPIATIAEETSKNALEIFKIK